MTRDDLKCVVDNACVSNAAGPDYLWPGFLLEPRLWDALRIELQSRYRRSTGETMAVLSVQFLAEPAPRTRLDVDHLAANIVTAACELDGPADPASSDTISITMKDLDSVVHRHVTAALEVIR